MHTEDVMLIPKYLLRDNDGKYTTQFDEAFESSGAEVVKTTPMSPNLRAHVERFIQTLTFECLDRFVIVSERHLNVINQELQCWYNLERPHSSRDFLPPAADSPPEPQETIRVNDVVYETRLGGVLKSYSRRAA